MKLNHFSCLAVCLFLLLCSVKSAADGEKAPSAANQDSNKEAIIAQVENEPNEETLPLNAGDGDKEQDPKPSIDLEEFLRRYTPGDNVKVTRTFWPSNPDNQLYSGEEAELLLLVRNDWSQNITVFGLTPSFRHPDEQNRVLRNLTAHRMLIEIPTGSEATISYRIKPEMDPTSVGLHIVVDFTDADRQRWYRVAGYSQVIHIIEGTKGIVDMQTVFLYLIATCLILGSFAIVQRALSKPTLQKRLSSGNPQDWIPDHLRHHQGKKSKQL